ncbi:MAG: pimeloyl-ACP methyl ester carboxylesterase [Planctomycetota bacterium]|jgi:pimeloyl-ACP methyl ester carboxylesterase
MMNLAIMLCLCSLTLNSAQESLELPILAQPKAAELNLEPVVLMTEDELSIKAFLVRASSGASSAIKGSPSPEQRPLLIMAHGSNRTKERWIEEGFVQSMRDEGYHIFAFDIRGRGESDQWEQKNPAYGVLDLEAALAWAANQDFVDQDRIALIGSSYGANLATAGLQTQDWNVRTVICFSATAASIRFLASFSERRMIPSGLYFACEQEPPTYDVLGTAAFLENRTSGEAQVHIYPDRMHAISMFSHIESVPQLVKDWLQNEFAKPPISQLK